MSCTLPQHVLQAGAENRTLMRQLPHPLKVLRGSDNVSLCCHMCRWMPRSAC